MRSASPLISIILPTRNRADYIERAIESVYSQTWNDFELIIVDDSSSDTTPQIVSRYLKTDPRIRKIINPTNLGLARSLNVGIKEARGVYVARIDDDDVWRDPAKLEKQARFLETHPLHVITGGGIVRVAKDGREIARYLFPEDDEGIRRMMLKTNPFVHASVMFRKDAWEKVGGYNESLEYCQDWDLWMRFGSIGKYHNFQEYFLMYLDAGQNRTARNIRYCHAISAKLRKAHKDKFPGFWEAYTAGWASYVFYFLPFRKHIRPLFVKIRRRLLDWY